MQSSKPHIQVDWLLIRHRVVRRGVFKICHEPGERIPPIASYKPEATSGLIEELIVHRQVLKEGRQFPGQLASAPGALRGVLTANNIVRLNTIFQGYGDG